MLAMKWKMDAALALIFRNFPILGLLLMIAVSLNACGSRTEKWKEEVQLSDGRMIVIERELINAGGGDEWASNRSGGKPKEYRIRFEFPVGTGKMIEWQSKKISVQTWPELPLIFDFESELPVVFSIVAVSAGLEVYSKYIYRNGAWIEDELPDTFEKKSTNLFLKLGVDMPSFVNLETKQKNNSKVNYPKFFKQVGPNRQVAIH
jgi:hypothetical protein